MKRNNKSIILTAEDDDDNGDNSRITRNDFPEDFIFGTGAASYQHEGAAIRDGRGISIWDKVTGRVADGSNGNVTVDMYDKFKEDIANMKSMGLDSFRFSISWPRLLPGGRLCAGVNKAAVDYYNDVINTLLANGLQPFVTLFHWDLPQCLQDEYNGFLDGQIVDDFREYVELCFWEFGDRVKYWVTLNETWTYAHHGYALCIFPPSSQGLLSDRPTDGSDEDGYVTYRIPKNLITIYDGSNGDNGLKYDPAKDTYNPKNAYIVAKYLLLAHAEAVKSYRTKFQERQGGKIGITLVSHWFEPLKDTDDDKEAALRAVDFMLGWFLEPIMKGRYPESMTQYAAKNIAPISTDEFEKIKGTIDFLGLNYYTTYYAANNPNPKGRDGYIKDQHISTLFKKNGKLIGPPASGSPDWLFIVPRGIRELLNYVNKTYNDDNKLPPIYITENGVDEANNPRLIPSQACIDPVRTKYHQDHLANLLRAMKNHVNVKGYFAWSWCDNFEWAAGYESRFGFMYVDYKNKLTRYAKDSAMWFAKFLMKTPNPPPNKRTVKVVDTESKKKLRAMEE
ncbi:hypothetical protein BUALT_Bualt10G0131100 [Buddleja alternifolia]|uniref:Beta-glucosidase n=1 Tax=Buddleja alternifolia TaxID=168488 RepID=A0AAV6WZI6_9LAMI|nr:hypothetical protein BUALT_Bualt10G0131100 [Buddleja alternifolia]